MCWNKESSFIGFVLNVLLIFLHKNKYSSKFIPIFITVALTQLFDFLVYSGYDVNIINKLLSITLSLQVFFIYKSMDLPKYTFLIPLILFFINLNWEPYKGYSNGPIAWKEHDNTKLILAIVWLLIPLIFNQKDFKFLFYSFILLMISDKFNFGSVGKNWCMLGVVLNLITYLTYKNKNYTILNEN